MAVVECQGTGGAPCRFALRGLYGITPDTSDDARFFAAVDAALAGGLALLQFRDKLSASTQRLMRAHQLKALCSAHGVPLIINDDVELALQVGADGVHLGAGDGDLREARARLGAAAIIGASCYADFARAQSAHAAGADYVAFGAAFASPTKPQAACVPHALMARAHRELPLPLAAIGGITRDNAPQLLRLGVDMLAVITDLFEAPDITRRARDFQSLFAGETHDNV